MDFFDFFPQKFYLLSIKCRKLFSFYSANRCLEKAVEGAFEQLPRIRGGNVYAEYRYDESVLSVMTELSEGLKSVYPSVQQLPSFFRKLEKNDIVIRQQASVSLCDLRRSIIKLRALSDSKDPEREDHLFVLTWGELYLRFEVYSYGFLTEKVFEGEDDSSKRVCRFCGETGADRFKNQSHSIMEGLGNRLLFCNEECDDCNQAFEKEVERHLFKFLEISRTLANVRGKGSQKHHLEGRNFHIHPDPESSLPIVYVKQEEIVNDIYKGVLTGRICLYNKGEISYYGVFKALVKIAVDMIPTDRIEHFKNTGRWVHGDLEDMALPSFLYGEHDVFYEQPVIDLFFRNEKSPHFSPYCTAILYIFSSLFIFSIPYNDIDGEKFDGKESLEDHWNFIKRKQYLYVAEWEEFDANDKTMLCPFYKIPIIPPKKEYKLVFRPSTDEVFRITR